MESESDSIRRAVTKLGRKLRIGEDRLPQDVIPQYDKAGKIILPEVKGEAVDKKG